MLGHGLGRIGRYASYGNAQVLGSAEIDIVEAGTAQGHEPRSTIRKCGKGHPIQPVINEGAYSARTFREDGRLGAEPRLLKLELMDCTRVLVCSLQEASIITLGTEYDDFHGSLQGAFRKLQDHSTI